MIRIKNILNSRFFRIVVIIFIVLWLLSLDYSKEKKPFTYGVSFSRFHTDELGLDWKETYLAILNDLKVRNFRFSAHWPLTEPEDDKFNFNELDYQIGEAEKKDASVILAVGRRLPGWPECHEPEWLKVESEKFKVESEKKKFKQDQILNYIEIVVKRYKDSSAIKYWQVENEPFLVFFSRSVCGALDRDFLKKEIRLVKDLDPNRQIIITDSGEFGAWYDAYNYGDVFGTSLYLYIWWREPLGPFRYPITPAFFRVKKNIIRLLNGPKESLIIELSTEPWLRQPIIKTPTNVQLSRMGIDKFNEMIDFSGKTDFDKFYFWGAEWWYWLKTKNSHSEFWDRAKLLF